MDIPNDRRFSSSHEWAKEEQGVATVGISDYAQDQLGDVVFVELPKVGTVVAAGDAVAVVESVKTASDIYAPVSGEVVEVNEVLQSKPEAINEGPYEGGWLFRIRVNDSDEFAHLLDADGYRTVIAEDS